MSHSMKQDKCVKACPCNKNGGVITFAVPEKIVGIYMNHNEEGLYEVAFSHGGKPLSARHNQWFFERTEISGLVREVFASGKLLPVAGAILRLNNTGTRTKWAEWKEPELKKALDNEITAANQRIREAAAQKGLEALGASESADTQIPPSGIAGKAEEEEEPESEDENPRTKSVMSPEAFVSSLLDPTPDNSDAEEEEEEKQEEDVPAKELVELSVEPSQSDANTQIVETNEAPSGSGEESVPATQMEAVGPVIFVPPVEQLPQQPEPIVEDAQEEPQPDEEEPAKPQKRTKTQKTPKKAKKVRIADDAKEEPTSGRRTRKAPARFA